MKKKRRIKRSGRSRVVREAKALLTVLGFRKPKGLDLIQFISDHDYDKLDKDKQDDYLKAALRAMPHLPPEIAETLGHPHPKTLTDGARFDTRSGATIYHDSESIRPYIGSAQEERDHQLTKGPLRPAPVAKKNGMTCVKCFGWGCAACQWWGST